MIVGETYAWAHIGKTGGDATHKLFTCVPDLTIENDIIVGEKAEQGNLIGIKHDTFQHRGIGNDKLLILNIRRLPSWVLSICHHNVKHKPESARQSDCEIIRYTVEKGTLPPGDLLCEAKWADEMLDRYTDEGKLKIGRWFRMEYLRNDIINFLSTLRALKDDEIKCILNTGTKKPMMYNHDPDVYFSNSQLYRLRQNNPKWSEIERKCYLKLI